MAAIDKSSARTAPFKATAKPAFTSDGTAAPKTKAPGLNAPASQRSTLGLEDGPRVAKTYKGHVDFVTAKDNVTPQKALDDTLDRFASDIKKLSPAEQKRLLSDPGFRIDVTGHASNLGNATKYDNNGLSKRRADHTADYVKDYLARKGVDVPGSAIHAKGEGTPGTPPKPIQNNDQNDRRAEVVIKVPEIDARKPETKKPEAPENSGGPKPPKAPEPPQAPAPTTQPPAPAPVAQPPAPAPVAQPPAPAPAVQPPGLPPAPATSAQPPARPPAPQPAGNEPAAPGPSLLDAIGAIADLINAIANQPGEAPQPEPTPEPPPRPPLVETSPRPSLEEDKRRTLEEEERKRLEEEEAKKREQFDIDPRKPIGESPYQAPAPEDMGGWKSPQIDPVELPKETFGGVQSDNSWKSPVSDGGSRG
jgi:outer membrane protein OmpA-like peptidoglycan-associated protein